MEELGLLEGKSCFAKDGFCRWVGPASVNCWLALLNIVPGPAAVLEAAEVT